MILVVWLACAQATHEPVATDASPAADVAPVGPADVAAIPPGAPGSWPLPGEAVKPIRTPKVMYEGCRDRVELPEAGGECTVDADCAKAGCAGEVCTTARAGAELTTACEEADCFGVLGTCGCHDGVCGWTLKLPAPL